MKAYLWTLTILAACGNSGGNTGDDDTPMPDAPKVFLDAPPMVPAMIMVGGTAAEQSQSGPSPLAGVAIAIYRKGNDTPLAMATSDAQGKYMMMVPTNMQALDGYIKASKSGFVDTYAYPPTMWIGDAIDTDANMITTSNYGFLVGLGGGSTSMGTVALGVFNASDMAVEGATIASTPASGVYKYSDPNGGPLPSGTVSTTADGRGFMFDVPPGTEVTVNAMKSGMSFRAHALTARAGAFTTTSIITQ